jgi:hypothetical protein
MKGFEGVPQQEVKTEEPKVVSPEDIGFRAIQGKDYFPPNPEGKNRTESMGIDIIEERRGRFEKLLGYLDKYTDKEVVTQLRQASKSILEQADSDDDSMDITAALDLVASIIANKSDKASLKMALERGMKDSMQETLDRARRSEHFPKLSEGAYQAYSAAVELIAELYAQEHDGHIYESTDRKKEIEEMKERSKGLNIS